MKKEEITKIVAERQLEVDAQIKEVYELLDILLNSITDETDEMLASIIKKAKWDFDMNRPVKFPKYLAEYIKEDFIEPIKCKEAYERLADIFDTVSMGTCLRDKLTRGLSFLEDSEKRYFKGDIIITDPCYIMKKGDYTITLSEPVLSDYVKDIETYDDVVEVDIAELQQYLGDAYYIAIDDKRCKYSYKCDFAYGRYKWDKSNYDKEEKEVITDDWSETDYGRDVFNLDIVNYMARDTIFGDWSCEVIDTATGDCIGEFCADAGVVCVAELGEWRKYNSEVDEWVAEHDWCAAIIRDFEGYIWFEVEDTSFDFTEENGNIKHISDYTLHVVGEGTKEGKPFSFKTEMGGL